MITGSHNDSWAVNSKNLSLGWGGQGIFWSKLSTALQHAASEHSYCNFGMTVSQTTTKSFLHDREVLISFFLSRKLEGTTTAPVWSSDCKQQVWYLVSSYTLYMSNQKGFYFHLPVRTEDLFWMCNWCNPQQYSQKHEKADIIWRGSQDRSVRIWYGPETEKLLS